MRDNSIAYLQFASCKSVTGKQEGKRDTGKISLSLSKRMASDRDPSLFDTKEMQERDAQIMEEMRKSDIKLCIDRRGKPVFLTAMQQRIVFALSYGLSMDLDSPDIQAKIKQPYNSKIHITRPIKVSELSKFLFGSIEKRYKEVINRELFKIASVRQCVIVEIGGKPFRATSPLLHIERTLEELTPEEQNDKDVIEVAFGGIFFDRLDTRFAILNRELFDVWRKKGRNTELYATLLNCILAVYWQYSHTANETEKRIRKENKELPPSELQDLILTERERAMTYEIKESNLKKRISRNYDSNRANKAAFRKDLENAIQGYKEAGLVKKGCLTNKRNGQDKIILVLSEEYGKPRAGETKLLGR